MIDMPLKRFLAGTVPRGFAVSLGVLFCALFCFLASPGVTQEPVVGAPTIVRTTNTAPFGVDTSLVLTDGTVICHRGNTRSWCKLTPDAFGSYVNGTWSTIASMPAGHGPLYYACAVLPDGRVVVCGGEYNLNTSGNPDDVNLCSIYNPLTNAWASFTPPTAGPIGDASGTVLPSGKLLLSNQFGFGGWLLDPTTLTWTSIGRQNKADPNSEETWTLLPDGSLLTIDCQNGRQAERYLPGATPASTGNWVLAGLTVDLLPDNGGFNIVAEMGAGVLRPDTGSGPTVFCTGASGKNAVYNVTTGVWSAAPAFPVIGGQQYRCADGPSCLLPNGNVVTIASPFFATGAHVYEFDGTSLVDTGGSNFLSDSSYFARMVLLPTGEALISDGSSNPFIYKATGGPNNAWRPTISSAPLNLVSGTSNYGISGTQFNGLSEGSSYGDDAGCATNYPLVRLTNHTSGHVTYCRTHNHSTMGVATAAAIVSTQFDVPAGLPADTYDMEVVANGIASAIRTLTVGASNPTASSQAVSVSHDTAKPITLTGSDPNNPAQTLTFSQGNPPMHGTLSGFNSATGVVIYTPNAGYHGMDNFTFTVTNTSGLTSAQANVSLNIAPAVPTANSQTVNTSQDTPVGVTLTGTDGDDNPLLPLIFNVPSLPSHGVLSGTAPNLVYIPNAGYSGMDSFIFTTNNGTFTSVPAIVTIHIAATVMDVSGQVTVARAGFRYNIATGQFLQVVTITNNGATINGPISLILTGLSANATLANATGTTSTVAPAGRPYIDLSAGSLANGASSSVTLQFNNPSKAAITYSTQVVAGSGSR